MRYQAEHKETVRARILTEAGLALRRDGAHGVSLASVMKAAGLTHGGFYSHFASRDDMLVAAIERAFDDTRARWAHETRDRSATEGLGRYIDWYLSKAHRDHRDTGCVIAAIGGELAQLAPACQDAFSDGVRGLIAGLAKAIGSHATCATSTPNPAKSLAPDYEELARSIMSEMIGALVLARIERVARRSDAMLADARAGIKKRLGI